MKNIYPAYPCYPQDFISSFKCQRMTLEEFGAFNWLLMQSWIFSDKPCHLPNDIEAIAWLLRSNCSAMQKIWEKIRDKFEITEDKKYIYNHRLLTEYNKLVNKSNIMRNNALNTKAKQTQSKSKANTKQTEVENEYENIIKSVIEYLNNKLNSNYRYNNKKTKEKINARIKEKYTLEDFKKVIDKKCDEWKDTEMGKYLRPETLFGNKFEGYLNQKINNKKQEEDGQNDYIKRQNEENRKKYGIGE